MMNSDTYWEELSDAIDNAIEDAEWEAWGTWSEDIWSD